MGTDYDEQRGELLQSIERDEEEVRGAVQELTGAARIKFDVGERIKQYPWMWLVGGVLLGLWWGSRRRPTPDLQRRR